MRVGQLARCDGSCGKNQGNPGGRGGDQGAVPDEGREYDWEAIMGRIEEYYREVRRIRPSTEAVTYAGEIITYTAFQIYWRFRFCHYSRFS